MSEGLFRDDDLIRTVGREGLLIAAGGTASLLQTAHPKVAQGVYDHSYTAEDPARRLRNTMGWLYMVQFGRRDEAEALSALVRKGHDHITGPGYEANDPELQTWVAATLFAVASQVYQAVFRRRFTRDELEAFYDQTKTYATILGCPREVLPARYPDFRAYYAHMLATLEITPASRAVADQVLYPTAKTRVPEPAMATVRLLTAGLMPPRIRAQYGWPWSRTRELRFNLLMTTLAEVYPRLPDHIRTSPRERFLSSARKAMNARR